MRKSLPFIFALILLAVLAGAVTKQSSPFTIHQKAYYLDPKEINFVRPGLQLTIV